LGWPGGRKILISPASYASGPTGIAADINPNSLNVLSDARVEPALDGRNSDDAVQFERQGYFCPDLDSTPDRLVFNRTVGLRDTWAKVAGGA
jgi:glutaminyl-tRNA synthetase